MNQKEKVDIILYNGVVLTINCSDEIIDYGAIAIKGNRIINLGKSEDIRNKYQAEKEIDVNRGVIMPGLVNTHTHLAMSLFRGLADDLSLDKWLNEHIFPAEEKFINKDSAYWGSLLSCAELILSGTTTFCDMYFFEKETGFAAEKAGVRGVIGEGIVSEFGDENEIFANKMELTAELLDKFEKSSLVSIAIEPHSCYTCSKEILIKAKRFADENNLLFVTHLCETKKEVEGIKNKLGMSPVEYLDEIGVLDERTLAAHCVWLSDADIDVLKKKDVKISHCPNSNTKLASGIAPVGKLLEKLVIVGLGTDGSASNNNLDMFSEISSASKLSKVSTLNPETLTARKTIRMATINGAKALGMEREIGSLEIGKKADIIILDFNKPHLVPIYNYYSHLVYSVSGGDVQSCIIDGKIVMEERKILSFNVEEVMQKVNEIARKINVL
ncbi:MAG: amidohydrolase [Candidatus Pacebacteria bacterium]|nr:amidohydrolase [Candidatus Paceibacterota bacterium]